MIVSEQQYREIKASLKRPSEESSIDSPRDLVALALKNQLQAITQQSEEGVQVSENIETTRAAIAASTVSDNIDEAFAKTRVQLSAADSTG